MKKIMKRVISAVEALALAATMTVGGATLGIEGFSVTVNAAEALTDNETGVTLSDSNNDGYYEIDTADELMAFSNLVNKQGKCSVNVVLTADIVMPAGTQWQPIGYEAESVYDKKYTGIFDGQGHTIKGLYIEDSDKNYVGLFGCATGSAEIKNVGVIDSTFIGKHKVAVICGELSSAVRIKNCFSVNCTVKGQYYVAGIAGYSNGSNEVVYNCFSMNCTLEGTSNVGGIAGYASKENCYATGENASVEDFISGKIAYLLNSNQEEDAPEWKQTLGEDEYPGFTGGEVMYIDGEYTNHQHIYEYSVSDNIISVNCTVNDCSKQGTITILASDKEYDGEEATVNVTNTLNNINYASSIVYKDNQNNEIGNAPKAAGVYTANLTIGNKTASVEYELSKATPVITITAVEESAINNTIDVLASIKNPNNNLLSDLPNVSFTYQVGSGSEQIPFTGSFVIPSDAVVGTNVIITATTEENSNYNATTMTHTIEVIECQHESKSTEWNNDENGHWYACTCGGKIEYADHQPGAAPTVDTPQTCTVCGYVLMTETGVGDFIVEGGNRGVDYTYENNILTIKTSKPLTISNKEPNVATSDMIKIIGGIDADITLAGVNIEADSIGETPLYIYYSSNNCYVKITLAEGTKNYLKGGYKAGLQKDHGNETLEITGSGYLYASGKGDAAGIGGASGSSCTNIIITGGCITASKIGGFSDEYTENVVITGGSVKGPVGGTPHDGNNNGVYLLTIENPDSLPVYINGSTTAYEPSNHTVGGEADTNLYVYLPAKTAQDPNVIKLGDVTKKYCYDVDINKWLEVVEAPEADTTEFVYDKTEKAYEIEGSDCYEISGNSSQINAGTYTITAELKDGYIWSDGTTEAKNYEFIIAPKPIRVTAQDSSKKYGQKDPKFSYIAEGVIAGDVLNGELTREPGEDANTYAITQNTITNSNNPNYDITFVEGEFTIEKSDVVIDTECKHTDVQSEWTSDKTHHWHICNDCGEKVAQEKHISSGEATEYKAEVCKVCNYEIAPKIEIESEDETSTDNNEEDADSDKDDQYGENNNEDEDVITDTSVDEDEDVLDNIPIAGDSVNIALFISLIVISMAGFLIGKRKYNI